jgi:hypothetical protein
MLEGIEARQIDTLVINGASAKAPAEHESRDPSQTEESHELDQEGLEPENLETPRPHRRRRRKCFVDNVDNSRRFDLPEAPQKSLFLVLGDAHLWC